jgi:CDGSH-type Zn-finger protein
LCEGVLLFDGAAWLCCSSCMRRSLAICRDALPVTRKHLNAVEEHRRQVLDVSQLRPGKNSFCRCWLSKKLPYCDGAHKAYNASTGDSVGPVVVMNGAEPQKAGAESSPKKD